MKRALYYRPLKEHHNEAPLSSVDDWEPIFYEGPIWVHLLHWILERLAGYSWEYGCRLENRFLNETR